MIRPHNAEGVGYFSQALRFYAKNSIAGGGGAIFP